MNDCPDDDVLARHVEGRATPLEAERVRRHLEDCASCRRLTAELLRSAVAATPFPIAEAEDGGEPRLPLVRGTRVGRYEVQGIIGAGAMGIVYAARDPDLDREVALKLIHPEASAEDAELLRERLIREARAMAKLVHPNVIAIHDVGASGDGVFIAMDLVHGHDVRAWLAERPRGWRQVLEVFLQAGRGLAAAHAAGLVHRDFKPDNVLVAEDGRVYVTDFGLARLGGGDAESGASGGSDADGAPSDRLTLTGMVLGTPAYMAPEQRAGRADARADIFAYSVALWESIHGEHPFPLGNRARLQEAMVAGRIKEPPAGKHVPRFVRRALLGGLAPDPETRTQTMERLLGALGRDRRRTFLAAAAVAGVLVAGAAAIAGRGALGPAAAPPCRGGERRWAGAWGPDRAAAMRGAFVATGKPYAADTASRAERLLQAYGLQWNEAYVDACEATRVRGDQSEALLDRRMSCLDDRLRDVAALGQTFLTADASVVAKAVQAADALRPLRFCADPARLLALTPPPEGREAAAHLEEARRLAASARALRTAGRVAECVDAAAAALTAARASGYAPIEAETLLELGLAQAAKGEIAEAAGSYRDAAAAAITGHDDVTSARAHSQLVYELSRARRTEEGLTMAELARAQVARAGGDPSLWVELLVARGRVYMRGDRLAAALGDYLLALTLFERANGGEHPQMGELLQNVGMDLGMMHRYQEEVAFTGRALAVLERTLGPQHPVTGRATSQYALGLLGAGQTHEALTFSELGLARQEAALGPDHPWVASALGVRGDVLAEAGHWQEAAPVYERGLAAQERRLGKEHDELVPFLMQGAKIFAQLGRDAEAAAWIARARAIADKTQARASWTHYLRYTEAFTLELAGKDAAAAAAYTDAAAELEKAAPESEEVGLALAGVARREERRGRYREALRLYDRALAALADSSGPQNATGMSIRAGRASCLLELGQAEPARSEAAAIVAFADSSGNIPDTAATARFVLARLEPDRAAARALAAKALAELTDDNARDRENRHQIEHWLQRR